MNGGFNRCSFETDERGRQIQRVCRLLRPLVAHLALHPSTDASCPTQAVISKFNLRVGKDQQTYGLGLKEVWRVPPDACKPG